MRTNITAHSGCENTPDNSFAFLEKVRTVHADSFEFDVRRREDGALYLSHDLPDGDTPLLSDAFQVILDCGKTANCDLKEPGLEYAVIEEARAMGVLDRICLTGTVSRDLMREDPLIRSLARMNLQPIFPPDVLRAPGTREFQHVLEICRSCSMEFINPPHEFCTEEGLRFFRENGIAISTWTVNTPEVARRLLEAGVANITSRCPEMVWALREELQP